MAARKSTTERAVCTNRRAAHRYELLETLECGVILTGSEIKSVREKHVSLEEAYARIDDGELWLIGCHIAQYRYSTAKTHDPLRARKLLVHARELGKLKTRVEQKGFTLVPLDIHFNERGIAKVTIAVGRGKGHADKREDIKRREHKREMDRALRRK